MFSVIVPVYNAEKTLERCVNSVLGQTYDDFEVILVDDCSTDLSATLCEKIAKKDKRVRVVLKEKNEKLPVTRNVGMSVSTGNYILFVDSDDYIETDLLYDMSRVLTQNNYDFLAWGMYDDIYKSDGSLEIHESSLNSKNIIDVCFPKNDTWLRFIVDTFFASTCNKAYKRNIVIENKLLFEKTLVDFEDYEFNLRYCQYVKSFYVSNKAYYHYTQPENQVATLKRRWGEVVPFENSKLIFETTDKFISSKEANKGSLDKVMLYVYKSFMSEFEYAFRSKSFFAFLSSARTGCKSKQFLETLIRCKNYGIEKFARIEINLIKYKLYTLAALFIWMMDVKTIGLKK